MLLFVHLLSENSVLNCLAIDPLNLYNFFIKILFLSLKTMFTNNAVTYYNVWDDVTSDCQIEKGKKSWSCNNSGTVLSGNNFNFILFLTLKEF